MNSDSQISADRGATESGSAGVLSSLRCCYSTECEDTGHLLPTSGGGSWGRSYSRPHPLEFWSNSYSSRHGDRAGESDRDSSHDGGGERGGEEDGGSLWYRKKNTIIESCYYVSMQRFSVPIVTVSAAVSVLGSVLEVATMVME